MPTKHDHVEKNHKIAVMGGTFDPIHNGHLAVAHAVLDAFAPQRILFMPGGHPPHKPHKPVTDGEHRFKMALAAVCETPAFDVSRLEIDREGPSYTVDTIEDLRRICPEGAEIYFIIGADALMEITMWEGADRLLKLCKFVAVCRPGYQIDNEYVEKLRNQHGAEVHILEGPALEISGTALREKFAAGKSVGGLMPKVAEDYAITHGLYNTPPVDLSPARFDAVKAELELRLSAKRFKHTLGTVTEAEKLANHYGADANKARWAALLHDCAKEFSAAKKHLLCDVWQIPTDDIMRTDIDITHSLLGAESARRHFYVTDGEILQAISRHTMGAKDMTLLDKIIMLADYIEPCRPACPIVAKQREQAYTNINESLITGITATNEDLRQRGKLVHPWCFEMLENLKEGL
ncbi:MAG: nicotinate-nucleotide adenylyltransferase [Defluviitaleaceae bacterium]|nr:nicotinate-nucleotide adenylyltransferase [Defluviitaleaceae bacterium]MCL2263434.1 nicotinate-nucleotide adenylyltransferase [Defluviitaleaceae bacterium]